MKRLCLCLGLLLFTSCQRQVVEAHWTAPSGPWAGIELVGLGWESSGPGDPNFEKTLELRCRAEPRKRVRQVYWPGPEWRGTVTWEGAAVTYQPPENWTVDGRPLAGISITAADAPWRSFCPPPKKS